MTEENPLTIAELGAYTNNSMNREGIKKLVDKVNEGGGVEYTAGANISISEENVISATDTKYTAGNSIVISENNEIKLDSSWVKVDSDLLSTSNKRKDFLKEYSKTHAIMISTGNDVFMFETPMNIPWQEFSDNLRHYPLKTVYLRNSEEYIYSLTQDYIISNNISLKQIGLAASNVVIDCADSDGTPITSSNIDNYITKTGTGATATYTLIKPLFVHIKFTSGSQIEVAGMCYGDNYSISFRKSDGTSDYRYVKVSLPLRAIYEWIINVTSVNSLTGYSVGADSSYFHTFSNSPTGNNWYIRKKVPNTYIEPTP